MDFDILRSLIPQGCPVGTVSVAVEAASGAHFVCSTQGNVDAQILVLTQQGYRSRSIGSTMP